ncbi:MAG: rhomboid family intramembrane serine protease [Gaiellaceae bacterium]
MIPLRDIVPVRRFPLVTVSIIAINVVVWLLYQVPHLQYSVVELGVKPCEIERSCADPGVPWPFDVVSAMFAHAGWLHILGNMLFLWIFGDNVEDVMGRMRFAIFYLLSGIAAMALQSAVTLALGSPAQAAVPDIGASGAIAGVLGAYFVFFPWARVLAVMPVFVLLVPVELPGVVFLGLWFLYNLWLGGFSLLAPTAGGGVAFFAHVGGFVFGLLAAHLFVQSRRRQVVQLRGRSTPGYRRPPWG